MSLFPGWNKKKLDSLTAPIEEMPPPPQTLDIPDQHGVPCFLELPKDVREFPIDEPIPEKTPVPRKVVRKGRKALGSGKPIRPVQVGGKRLSHAKRTKKT